jgi:hypothetical protein
MSVAFYPTKGLICYGSEQAAVKAGLNADFPGDADVLGRSQREIDHDALRLDLDDMGGEILVLDWGQCKYKNPPGFKAPPPSGAARAHERKSTCCPLPGE